MRLASTRVEESEIVENFSDRADGRPGVGTCALLLDGNGRRQALDRIYIGLVHLVEKHACIHRERLDVAALTFRVDGVKCERRLPRTRNSGNDNELLTGNFEVYALEIVFASAANHDLVGVGRRFRLPRVPAHGYCPKPPRLCPCCSSRVVSEKEPFRSM